MKYEHFRYATTDVGRRWMPWVLSVAAHAAVIGGGVLVVFLAQRWTFVTSRSIVPPTSFRDPSYSDHPGSVAKRATGDEDSDPFRSAPTKASQRPAKSASDLSSLSLLRLPNVPASSDAPPAPLSNSIAQTNAATPIGQSASPGQSTRSDGLAGSGFSTPSLPAGSGPKLTFLGTGGNAKRIVYILDRSASLVDHFEFLKHEVTGSINHLIPLQSFNVILVSDRALPIAGNELVRATGAEKTRFAHLLQPYVAEGQNDGELPPFQEGFEQAFAMRPELIFFLTDGEFDPRLLDVVKRLNAHAAASGAKVVINTIAYTTQAARMTDPLKTLANQNGGVYKFISGDPGESR